MGTTSDKIQYLLETKNLIKNALISRDVDITDETSFREYAAKINEIKSGYAVGDIIPEEKLEKAYQQGDDYVYPSTNTDTFTGITWNKWLSYPFCETTRHTAVGSAVIDETGNVVFDLGSNYSGFQGASASKNGDWYGAMPTTSGSYRAIKICRYSKDGIKIWEKIHKTTYSTSGTSISVCGVAVSDGDNIGIIVYKVTQSAANDLVKMYTFTLDIAEKVVDKNIYTATTISASQYCVHDRKNSRMFIQGDNKVYIRDMDAVAVSNFNIPDNLHKICSEYNGVIYGIDTSGNLCTLSSTGVVADVNNIPMNANTYFRISPDGVLLDATCRPYSLISNTYLGESPNLTLSTNTLRVPIYSGKRGFAVDSKAYLNKDIFLGYKILE